MSALPLFREADPSGDFETVSYQRLVRISTSATKEIPVSTTVFAIYEGGLLRPTEPLELTEGQRVRVTVHPPLPLGTMRPPTAEETEYARRVTACKSIDELLDLMGTLPTDDDGFDILADLNENRTWSGWGAPIQTEGPHP